MAQTEDTPPTSSQAIAVTPEQLAKIVHDAEKAVLDELRAEDAAREAFAQHWDKIMIMIGITMMIIFAMFKAFDPWGVITGSASTLGVVVRSLPFISPRQ